MTQKLKIQNSIKMKTKRIITNYNKKSKRRSAAPTIALLLFF